MGINESKLLATHVLKACNKAQKEGKIDLDPSFLWASKDIENIARSVVGRIPARISRRQNKVDRAAQIYSPIRLPQELQPLLEQWKTLPQEFRLRLPESRDDRQALPVTSPDEFVAKSFLFLCGIERAVIIEKIRCRLCYVAFYLMKDQLQRDGFRQDAIVCLSGMIKRTDMVSAEEHEIQGKLRTWVDKGERLWLLSMDLEGPGVLFLLPEDIGENIWLQELPKGKGPRRSNMLMSLKRRGITQEASRIDAHHTAHQILSLFLFAVGLVSHRLEQYLRIAHETSVQEAQNPGISQQSPTPPNPTCQPSDSMPFNFAEFNQSSAGDNIEAQAASLNRTDAGGEISTNANNGISHNTQNPFNMMTSACRMNDYSNPYDMMESTSMFSNPDVYMSSTALLSAIFGPNPYGTMTSTSKLGTAQISDPERSTIH
ncbi:hypothetical protein AAWM_03305 [Aspergillus awamori]|uniref:Uncharacterized protein n=1 Tax=Aspergillus awamori TaxID=105351 RepID=A0A401KMD1_ASPAW|nr:hypothetical protein AAWM_03305 [Aspergillus awamori]